MGQIEGMYEGNWRSVSLVKTEMGLTACEKFERFKLEAMSELALRLAGGLMVAGSTLLWLVLPTGAGTEQIVSHSLLATLFTSIGLFVYAYGTRGFRRQIALNATQRTLSLTKININDQSRFARIIATDKIESMFLRRPSSRPAFAALYIRVSGTDAPQLALTGHTKELEVIHQELCDIIKSGLDTPRTESEAALRPARRPTRQYATVGASRPQTAQVMRP